VRPYLVITLSLVAAAGCKDQSACTLELGFGVAPFDTTITMGSTYTLRARYTSCGGRETWPATDAVWGSQDPSIAAVDSFGRVSGIAPGYATLAVSSPGFPFPLHPTVSVRP
jgi:uncharacterized protein YjdB